jgi:hypothetical protein
MNYPQDILSLLESGLKANSLGQAERTLGDRQTYLGMSDLAQGLSCPRAVLAKKLSPEDPSLNLKKLIQLERGHWLEYGIEKALKSVNQNLLSQLEISVVYKNAPVKAHLDLVLVDPSGPNVTVLELKSLAAIKDCVYESHEAQLLGQIGLLSEFWNEPVFSLEGFKNHLSFSELAVHSLGIKLPTNDPGNISITGYVLCVSHKDVRAFGPYKSNSETLTGLLETGYYIWQTLSKISSNQISLNDVQYQTSFLPLCDYCLFNRNCPKFSGDSLPELAPELSSLANLKAQKSMLEDEISERESQLKAIASLMGKTGQWISSDNYRFKVAEQKGRISLDQGLLKSNLKDIGGIDEETVLNVWSLSQKEGRSFERFYLSPVN